MLPTGAWLSLHRLAALIFWLSWLHGVLAGTDTPALLAFYIVAAVLFVLSYLVRSTKAGKAMRATAQDQDAAGMMGINVDRTISFTFALGGALAGAAGAIYAMYIGNTKFDLGFRLGLFAFTAAVLGGIGNLNGAVLGGILLGVIAAIATPANAISLSPGIIASIIRWR